MDNFEFPTIVPILEFASRGNFLPFLKVFKFYITKDPENEEFELDYKDSFGYSILHHAILKVNYYWYSITKFYLYFNNNS